MTPRIDDALLRAELVAWFRERAMLWHWQGDHAYREEDGRRFHVVAATLEEMGRELEYAALMQPY